MGDLMMQVLFLPAFSLKGQSSRLALGKHQLSYCLRTAKFAVAFVAAKRPARELFWRRDYWSIRFLEPAFLTIWLAGLKPAGLRMNASSSVLETNTARPRL